MVDKQWNVHALPKETNTRRNILNILKSKLRKLKKLVKFLAL